MINVITVQQIMSWHPCSGYTAERVTELIGAGKSPRELAALEIPIEDRPWVLHRILRSVSVEIWKEYLDWCALRACCYADAAAAADVSATAANAARTADAAYRAAVAAYRAADVYRAAYADAAADYAAAAYADAAIEAAAAAAYHAARAATPYATASGAARADYAAEQQMQLAYVLELIERII